MCDDEVVLKLHHGDCELRTCSARCQSNCCYPQNSEPTKARDQTKLNERPVVLVESEIDERIVWSYKGVGACFVVEYTRK